MNRVQRAISTVSNWMSLTGQATRDIRAGGGSKSDAKNLSNSIIPIQLMRVVQTIGNWRQATNEAEYAYFPYRVKMQQLYNDLIDEPHLSSCIERRMDLTLMRDFVISNKAGKEYEEWTEWLKEAAWFTEHQRYVLWALFRGYCLESIGDIVDNGLPDIKLIEHSVISPDREYVGSAIYMPSGPSWNDAEYKPWHIYVKTPTEIGRGVCGYGILHKVAVATIILRNNLSDNATYNERFGMPVTWGKTDKTDDERTNFFQQLKQMGASSTFVTDTMDELEFLSASGSGQGFKTYPDLEMRCQKLISKRVLGHADVMDSIPKRSGSAEGNSQTPTTPVQEALSNIRSKDGKFVTPYNNQLLDLLRQHGVGIPADAVFRYKNDEEEEEVKRKADARNASIATTVKTFKDGGYVVDPKWIETETGIPGKAVAEPKPVQVPPAKISADVQNKLNSLYNHKH